VPCDPADPTLKLCLDFEAPLDLGIADLSADGVLAITDRVGSMDRDSERAAVLNPGSTIHMPEQDKLDVTGALALDLWIRPMGLPPGPGKAWLLDNDKQYGARIEARKVLCVVKDKLVESAPLADDADWHHVACTYDGQVMKVFVDGELVGCRGETLAIPVDGRAGLALGANVDGMGKYSESYRGGLDNVRVWARADIDACAVAGATGCATACP
jgi:hypothetical protein